MDQTAKLVMTVRESMPLKAGFALVQLLIGLAILGVAGSIVLPSFSRQIVHYQQNKCLAELDGIVVYASLNAIKTGKVHTVKFNIASGLVIVELQQENENGETVTQKVASPFSDKDFVLPKSYQIVNFYIDGKDEYAELGAGRTMQDVFFYVYPRGHTQAIIINMVNQDDTSRSAQGAEIGLVLNPFRLQFEVHDAFQKP